MAALGSLRGGSSSPVVPVGTGWEFASAYGPLVRLAIFELTSGESDGRWSAFVTLFRHYFGRQIDPLLPSVYLAAVTHPQVLRTDAMCADAACLTRLLYSDADLLETLRDSGLMQ